MLAGCTGTLPGNAGRLRNAASGEGRGKPGEAVSKLAGEHKVHPYLRPETLCRGESCIRPHATSDPFLEVLKQPSEARPFLSTKPFISVLLLWILLILVMVSSSFAQTDDVKHYLLMEEIKDAIKNVKLFKSISTAKISVNLESPLILHGYLPIDKFIDDFALEFSRFETLDIEWVSIQLEEEFTVQSLALVLKDKQSEKTVYYKLIFFLVKKDKEWKIYYLRGLKI